MRKADGTEASLTRHSVEMESDLKAGKPLEPKELVDREPNDKKITDAMETVKVILELSDIKDSPEDWFESQGFDLVKKKDGTNLLIDNNQQGVITDIVKKTIDILYSGKWAYLKKGEYELYGPVEVKRYTRDLATPLGHINVPIITVKDVPVFFNSKWCLSEGEKSTYELYNNKEYDYDGMELEKKIMGDLILYSQLGTKTLEDSKTIFDKIESECNKMGILKRIKFDNGVFTLVFDWRIGFDTAHSQKPMVFPPFTITIDFFRKTLGLDGWHPHRWNGGFCLGGELTKIKDRCFKEKDIYGLVMGMVQFGGEWNSSDVGHSERHPGGCIINSYNDGVFSSLDGLPVSKEEILLTIAEYSYTYLLDHTWTSMPFKDLLLGSESFRALMADRLSQERRVNIINGLLSETEKKKDFIKALME